MATTSVATFKKVKDSNGIREETARAGQRLPRRCSVALVQALSLRSVACPAWPDLVEEDAVLPEPLLETQEFHLRGMKMPGRTGSENRQRQIVRSTRWDEDEFAQLQAIATYSGCSEAEVLRRLVRRSNKQIVISRDLVRAVRQLGNNVNQIARCMNSGEQVPSDKLIDAYRELLQAVNVAKS